LSAGSDAASAGASGVPLLELEGVSLVIDDAVILEGIDLAIADAGITVVVGPSGAGKSMLLRLLNRLEVPTSGDVRFRGSSVSGLDPLALRRRVGMVFQRPAPFPGTVRDNLLVADPGADDEALLAALADARLGPEYLDRDADELSGGEAQRMCLARTLVTGPEALLMDEPTSALDRDATRGLERTARRLATAGRPLVWVTHDLEQCERLADAVVVLIDGHLAGAQERERFLSGDDVSDDEEEAADMSAPADSADGSAARAPDVADRADRPGRTGGGTRG
jgi:putative ABC transport system ATP-binding protein